MDFVFHVLVIFYANWVLFLLIQFVGLLHDVGHGPFSHLFEREFLPRVLADHWYVLLGGIYLPLPFQEKNILFIAFYHSISFALKEKMLKLDFCYWGTSSLVLIFFRHDFHLIYIYFLGLMRKCQWSWLTVLLMSTILTLTLKWLKESRLAVFVSHLFLRCFVKHPSILLLGLRIS